MLGAAVGDVLVDAAGYFGKVAAFADFISRRLPRSFIDPWDAWLQQALVASRERLGVSWLDTYLISPLWRFTLMPGLCGASVWAGVFMPSVDRVGRHFPFTVAAPFSGETGLFSVLSDAEWFDKIENLALSTLDEPFDLERFDADLQQLRPAPVGDTVSSRLRSSQNEPAWCFELTSVAAVAQTIPALAHCLLEGRLDGQTLWWTAGSAKVRPCVLTCKGLPNSAAFAAFLDGNWTRWGWSQWL